MSDNIIPFPSMPESCKTTLDIIRKEMSDPGFKGIVFTIVNEDYTVCDWDAPQFNLLEFVGALVQLQNVFIDRQCNDVDETM